METGAIFEMIYGVIGGLGIFLLGMKYMSEGMQAVAGEKLRKLIGAVTNNRFMACGVGTLVTCVIQSSSVTTVMVVGMVNAGLMTLMQAIGVIMGANIGTTITGWILVLKIGKYGLPMLGIAAFFFLFSKRERIRFLAMFFMGLGMVFFGLQLMKHGFAPIKDMPSFEQWFLRFQPTTYFGVMKCVLAGALLTAIVQSSSATLGITMGLAATGAIDYMTAAALVLGENIGTTITAFLASLGTSTTARRAAYAHSIFNVLGVLWITTLFMPYTNLVSRLITRTQVDDIAVIMVPEGDEGKTNECLAEYGITDSLRDYVKRHGIETSLYVLDNGIRKNNNGYTFDSEGSIIDTKGKVLHEDIPYVHADDFIRYTQEKDLTHLPSYTQKGVSYPFTQAAIAFTHSGFNIVNTLLFLPFISVLARLLLRIVPEKAIPEKPRLTYLNVRMLDTPAIAVQQSYEEVVKMGESIIDNLPELKNVLSNGEPDSESAQKIFKMENDLDVIQMEISEFLGDIMSGNISHEVVQEGRSQLRISDEFESISDYMTNILKLRLKMQDTQQTITEEGIDNIQSLHDMVGEYLKLICTAVENEEGSLEFFSQAKTKGTAITKYMKECRAKHLERVGQGIATPLKSLIYTDMLTAYRRIKDHAFNIAEVLAGEK